MTTETIKSPAEVLNDVQARFTAAISSGDINAAMALSGELAKAQANAEKANRDEALKNRDLYVEMWRNEAKAFIADNVAFDQLIKMGLVKTVITYDSGTFNVDVLGKGSGTGQRASGPRKVTIWEKNGERLTSRQLVRSLNIDENSLPTKKDQNGNDVKDFISAATTAASNNGFTKMYKMPDGTYSVATD